MIANSEVFPRVSFGGWWLLMLVAVTLVLLPARAQESQRPSQPKTPVTSKDTKNGRSDSAVETTARDTNPDEAAGKYFVTGSVFDEETKQPIAAASIGFLVQAEQNPEKRMRKVRTDANGQYRLEVPMGNIRLWFPELKPGYWLEPSNAMTPVVTSDEKPVATLDIAAKRGSAWAVQVLVDGGLPEKARSVISVMEVEDDAARQKVVNGEPVSFQVSPNQSITQLDTAGRGAFTQCGKSGKLYLNVGVIGDSPLETNRLATDFVVDPAFDNTKIKSASPIAGTDTYELIDETGKKATIRKATVTVTNGEALITLRLEKNKLAKQVFIGLVVDQSGKGISDVRVGTAIGSSGGSGEWPLVVTTNTDGQFRLEVPLPTTGQKHHLKLILNKDGFAAHDSPDIPLPKQPVDAMDVGKLTMRVGHSLPVLVVNAQDEPLAGAIVEPIGNYAQRRLSIRTDAQGRGVLKNLPVGLVRAQVSHGNLNDACRLVVSAEDSANTETKIRIKAPAAASVVPKQTKPIAVGQLAPELSIEQWTDGKQHHLSDYRGQIVVLDFWGTWCGPCVSAIPTMQELAVKYQPKGVIFLAIHTPDGDVDQINKLKKVNSWMTESGIDRGTTISDGASAKSYGVHGYPTVIVIDSEGKIGFNSGIEPQDRAAFMKDIQQLAQSLQIPWPLPDKPDDAAISEMNKLFVALYSREIDKVIAAGRKK